jgi:polysaccharide deacetylase 2 family uncharacterized protein YibQ
MKELSPKQFKVALIVGVLVYAAFSVALLGWLIGNSEDTVQKRIAKIPSASVSLLAEKAETPASWTEGAAPEAAKADEKPIAEQIAQEVKEQPAEPENPEMPPEQKADETEDDEKTEPESAEPPKEDKRADGKPDEAAPPVEAAKVEETAPTTSSVSVAKIEDAKPATPAGPRPDWQRFARPFNQSDTRPRIGLIVTDLGFAQAATETAVQDLPGDVTLAFSSLANGIDEWIIKARAAGHEAIITIPMEPENYPQNDPGPNTLLTSLPDKDNVSRIRWALARAGNYVAVMPSMGEKFVLDENRLAPILDVVGAETLMMVDSTLSKDSLIPPLSRLGKIPFVRADLVVDAAASRTAIQEQLTKLEELAKTRGQAIGIATPYPVTFEQLKPWIASLEAKGIVLAPITALASEEIPVVQAEAPAQAETQEKLP